MSIYKGGYILADISGTSLSQDMQDLLPQDLKNYLLRYINNGTFTKEVLSKPIILIIKDMNNQIKRISIDTLTDDYSCLYNLYNDNNGTLKIVEIYPENLQIKGNEI